MIQNLNKKTIFTYFYFFILLITLFLNYLQMKLIVYRPEQVSYTTIEVELIKKSGKGLGISVIARKEGKGVYISEIVSINVSFMCFISLIFTGKHVFCTIFSSYVNIFSFKFTY